MKVLNSYKICLSKKTGILCGFYKFLNVLFEIAQQVNLISRIIKIIAPFEFCTVSLYCDYYGNGAFACYPGAHWKELCFPHAGGEISHVYLLPDIHSVNEIFYGMISLYNRRKAMR